MKRHDFPFSQGKTGYGQQILPKINQILVYHFDHGDCAVLVQNQTVLPP